MKQRLYLDTNVIIDLLGERQPFNVPMEYLATLADHGKLDLYASVLSMATTFYILSKHYSQKETIDKIKKFNTLCQVVDASAQAYQKAIHSEYRDFEDAIQFFCAEENHTTCIITRNLRDFKSSQIPIMTAEEYIAILR
jgi:predicted nucleic acid-binding protein